MSAMAAGRYRESDAEPLSDVERREAYRMMTDPLLYPWQFRGWIHNMIEVLIVQQAPVCPPPPC